MAKKELKIDKNLNNNVSYEAKDIYVLEGLDPVRKRPGMYIGSTGVDGLHHLIWEVVDNSIDEAMAGFAKNIRIELFKDNKVAVADDGRGIPVDIHPQTKKSALETVMCTLHAGGKFGGESYKVSGGLHGVGVSVVNALSKWMRAEVCRNGNLYFQEYERGKPKFAVKKGSKCGTNGTKIIFEADPEVFQKISFNRKVVSDHLRQQAFLTKGVKIEIIDEREENPFYYSFQFEGGLLDFIDHLNRGRETNQQKTFYVNKNQENIEVEAAFIYNEDSDVRELSFANNIYTPDGGMHLTGFRSALTRVLNDYARNNNHLKEAEENLTGDDVREGLTAIVSIRIREPQFEGQTKARLGNPEARTAVESAIGEALKEYLEKYSSDARVVIEKCLLAQKARKAAKAAKDTVLRKGALEGMSLPGKLADCSSRDAGESELFIVEGDSAGGCFSGDIKVALIDGRNLDFKELIKEYHGGKKNYCYTIKNGGEIGVAEIKNPRITKKSAEVIKVVLDNNEEVVCTPDHKFMLRNGAYKMAKDLTPNDSLMPLYRQYSKIGKRITIEGYEMVFDCKEKRWIFTHLLSDKQNLEKGIYLKKENDAIHHIDFNKLNNNPDNLMRMPKMEHLLYHTQILEKTLHREDIKERARKAHQSEEYKEKVRKIMTTPKMRKMLSKRAKKQWQNKEYKSYMIRKFLDFYNNNPDYRKKNNELLVRVQKEYWRDKKNRKKQSEKVRKYFENHPEIKKQFATIAKKQWDNSSLLKWRSVKTKEQWTDEFRQMRKDAYNKTYLNKALSALYGIYKITKKIDKGAYNRLRKETNDKSLIRYETIRDRFFGGNEEKIADAVSHFNHRIKMVIPLKEKIDVYDIEVPETHNFALAGGIFVHNSSKQARDRRTQAILPLRGKILNVEKSRIDKMLMNNEIKSLIIALGTAIADNFEISKLRYHKVVIMTDADSDGGHIRTLLLTLFYRHFLPVIEGGYLYIAQPPLYRIQIGKEARYAYNDLQKDKIVKEMTAASKREGASVNIQRYKGLGEMNPEQLWETTMDPEKRTLKLIGIEDAEEADRLFSVLMSDSVEPRKQFIQRMATTVKNLDI